MRVKRTIEIRATPESVYEVVMNPRRLKDWVTIHQRLDGAPRGQLEKGSKLTQSLKLAGRSFKVHWTVVEVDPLRRVVWEGRGPVSSKARVEYEFSPNGEGTRFFYVNEYDLPGGPLGKVAGRAVARVTEKELEGSLRRLKSIVE